MMEKATGGETHLVTDPPGPTAEQALLRVLFEAMPQLGWTARPDGFIDYYNRGWYEYTGTTSDQMQGWGWQSVHDPRHLPRVLEKWKGLIEAGEPGEMEFPLRRWDGAFRWFLTRVHPLRDEAGTLVRWVGINTDIHDQKAAHEELQTQRARYLKFVSQAPVAIGLLSGPAHVVELANSLMCDLWGRTPEQVLGKPLLEALPEIEDQGFGKLLDGVFNAGVAYVGNEVPVKLARGTGGRLEPLDVSFVYEPMRNEAGIVDGIAVIGVDVTPQVQARQALAEKARQSHFTASVGIALTSDDPLPVQLNQCCEAMVALGAAFGRIWTHNEPDGVLELQASAGLYTHLDGPHSRVPVGSMKIGLIAAERQPHLTNAVTTDPRVSDHEWANREGLTSFAGYPLVLGDRLVGVMALFARQALSHDTLHALGTVANQIALAIARDRTERFRELFIGMLGHDLRSPLSAILMGAQVLSRDPDMPERPKRVAERIKSSAGRMNRMVNQLLDYARARTGGGIPVAPLSANIFEIGRDVIQELEQANAGRTFDMTVSGEGNGEWDVDRMAQVFSNLIGNAVAYGQPDESVRVTLRGEADRVIVEVANRGVPIPKAALPHVFDLFLRGASTSMSASTSGLGLGLFITREIIRAHGGTITAASSEADGTSFVCSIPRRPRSPAAGRAVGGQPMSGTST